MKPPLEKVEQQWGVQLLRAIGANVWVTGVPRRKGDYQGAMRTPGLPDVFAFLPPHDGRRRLLCWEVKRQGRLVLRPEQKEWVLYVQAVLAPEALETLVGPYDTLLRYLVDHGYLSRDSVAHYRAPRKPTT